MTCEEIFAAIVASNDPAERQQLAAQYQAQGCNINPGDDDGTSGGHGPGVPPGG